MQFQSRLSQLFIAVLKRLRTVRFFPADQSLVNQQMSDTKVVQTHDGRNEGIRQPSAKKLKIDTCQDTALDDTKLERKKKVAMLLVYSGKGYLGMQRNPGFKTIESDLLDALVKAGVVRPDHIEQPGVKMAFQRAARTDKGVSAAGQIVSLKMLVHDVNAVENINRHLPEQIKVLGLKRVTKGFDSKNSCDSRTYCYITPTFAFAPVEEIVTESYRISGDVLQSVRDILNLFKGTHNFHNFTSGKKPNDPSAKRFIMDISVGSPFVRDELEFVTVTVQGQSFMLHQIRKMIGITMAIMRGMTGLESIHRSWEPQKVDVPKAPGLGLVLERLHYDAYNRKYGSDGMHEKLEWDEFKDEIDRFKENFIYPTIYTTEKSDKSMIKWLATLPLHHYGFADGPLTASSPYAAAENLVEKSNTSSDTQQNLADTQNPGPNTSTQNEILDCTNRDISTSDCKEVSVDR